MKRAEIPAELLADVKNYLNITWEDKATDGRSVALLPPVRFIWTEKAEKRWTMKPMESPAPCFLNMYVICGMERRTCLKTTI